MIAAALLLFLADDAGAVYRRGVEALERGDTATATVALKEATRLAPGNAQAWKALGVAYASVEDFEGAAEPFARACQLAPKMVDACYYMGRNLYALNRFGPALDALRKALRDDRAPFRVHLGIAQALEALGKPEEAEKEFRIAVKDRQPGHADFDPRLHYAVFLFRQGRTAEALAPASEVVRDHAESARARFELGRVLYQLDRLSEAVPELERAVALGHGVAAESLLKKARARAGARQ